MKPFRHPASGVTLIEIVVTLAVLGVVAVIIGRPIISLIENRNNVNAVSSQQAEIDYALARMATAIRLSSNTVTQCDAAGLTVDSTAYRFVTAADGNGRIEIGGEMLVNNISSFNCRELGADLGLYQLRLTAAGQSYQVRAFKREQSP